MSTARTHLRRHLAAIAAVGGLVLLASCGDDAETPVASTPTPSSPGTSTETTVAAPPTQPSTTAPATTSPATSAPVPTDPASAAPVAVIGADFEFVGLPTEVAAGTQFQFGNESAAELHEMVAVRIAEGDQRPLIEIVNDDLGSLFAAPPSFVLLAPPGGEQITALGDGTLSEPGRYAVVCMIPTGIDPFVYLDAAAQSGDGPPQVEGGGAPHIFSGMYAEVTVTAAG
jgi:hypothetical protein